jgi:hypothetical protein
VIATIRGSPQAKGQWRRAFWYVAGPGGFNFSGRRAPQRAASRVRCRDDASHASSWIQRLLPLLFIRAWCPGGSLRQQRVAGCL